ncbi:DHA2 family multidrug resistance protein-like MFS transporter [Lipingzhangella halophila]|uniref:DHA2 family multidrug resistance protein-like MFS transporter n=1 Tax=Lipingzhangella halophila TaxID=1783352 RepID=A0A7W7RDG6_9ACTN|nr:MFS transporter [Lipingzhangella halophila]MBB4929618.1 DHA2 family multidrug resistance protein-like MFS transporter [Lipingzhangella halophila]
MTDTSTTESVPRAGQREWLGLAVLALPTLLLSVDMSVLYLAVPHLAADLAPSSSQLLWIMDIYAFMIAGFLITMGTLGDRIGRRRLLLIGAAAFGVASVLAAFSTGAGMLIAARTALGLAGATLMPSTLALISTMFAHPKQRAVAIAVWMSCFTGGAAVGPVVGGLLLQWFWWGSVFLLGVPVMALLLVAAPLLLPEYRNPNAGRLDLFSVALSLATILPIVYGLKELAKGDPAAAPFVAIVLGAAAGAGFVRRQLRLTDPLLDLRLFRNRAFSTALGVMMVSTLAMGGMFMLISQYLQLVNGLSPLEAGLWLVPPSVAMITVTLLAPAIAQRIGRGTVIGSGMVIAAAGFGLLTQASPDGGPVVAVVGQTIVAAGLGPGAALLAGVIVGSAPKEKAGSAAAVSETSGELGMALGVALLGSITTAVYRGAISLPGGIPADAETAARDTLAGASAAAEGLPASMAAQLLEPAREAFTQGMGAAAGLGAGAAAVFGVLAIVLLRQSGASDDPRPDDTAEPAEQPAG